MNQETVRLSKRVVEIAGCSRKEADQYVMGGWVLVDGQVVDEPQFAVSTQIVTLDPEATLEPTEPATLLLNKPAGIDAGAGDHPGFALLERAARSPEDASGIRTLHRHFMHQTPIIPLERQATGMQVYTQDPRLLRRIREDATRIEQEFIVEVAGEIAPYGLNRLRHGLSFNGRNLPPCSVSWQNETRLRFALKGVQDGQLAAMCADVGLAVVTMKRIRLGRVPLARMPVGQWRYLLPDDRF